MGKSHDVAARRIAKQNRGTYWPKSSPDVRAYDRLVEVKSKASELPKALRQLGKGQRKKYVALPGQQVPTAVKRLKGTGVGVMNYHGKVVKRARRRG